MKFIIGQSGPTEVGGMDAICAEASGQFGYFGIIPGSVAEEMFEGFNEYNACLALLAGVHDTRDKNDPMPEKT